MTPALFDGPDIKREKLSRKERDNRRQRQEILRAALQLFSEKGYHNVSMQEIAGQAEFGIGTLYKFFANKEAMYKALMMEMAETWNDILIHCLEKESNPLEAINRYVEVRRELVLDNLPLMRLYFAETRGASFNIKAGLDRDLLKLYDELVEKVASVFVKGMNQGVFRKLDPYHMALALEGTINAFLFEIMQDSDRFKREANLATVADIFFKGVLEQP